MECEHHWHRAGIFRNASVVEDTNATYVWICCRCANWEIAEIWNRVDNFYNKECLDLFSCSPIMNSMRHFSLQNQPLVL